MTEASGAPWLADTGLPLDERGFLVVDESLRSPADPAVFAAGDIATMPSHPREKAGVYAVRAGPPLADNLRRALAGRPLRRAVPQKRALALIGTGDGKAVASRGPFAAHGRSLWLLKDWIDRRWMRRYTELPFMAEARTRRRGRDALRRLRRQGAGRGAGARDGAARPGVEALPCRSGSAAPTTRRSCRFPARRRCCRRSISSARWSTIRICSGASPPTTRSATSTRWADCRRPRWRSRPCRRRSRHHGAGSVPHAEGRHRGARRSRRGADRRPQRRGRRIGARFRGDRADPPRPPAAQGRAGARRPAGADKAARDRGNPRRRDARARHGAELRGGRRGDAAIRPRPPRRASSRMARPPAPM